jgi:D-serine deaminase-like pyridoxal phosphate-dependent protein
LNAATAAQGSGDVAKDAFGEFAPSVPVQVGDRIELWVHYSDATVNLHERMYGIRSGRVEKLLVVDGRGR